MASKRTSKTKGKSLALEGAQLENVEFDRIVLGENSRIEHLSDADGIESLAVSILDGGFLQPLVGHLERGKIVLDAGFRRYRAVTMIRKGGGSNPKLKEAHPGMWDVVPVMVIDKKMAKWVNVRENLHRKNLSVVEQGLAFQELAREYGLTHEAIADEAGLARPSVSNAIRIVTGLAPEIMAELKTTASANHPPANYLLKLIQLDGHEAQLAEWKKRGTPGETGGNAAESGGGGTGSTASKMRPRKEIQDALNGENIDLPHDARIVLQWVMRERDALPEEWLI